MAKETFWIFYLKPDGNGKYMPKIHYEPDRPNAEWKLSEFQAKGWFGEIFSSQDVGSEKQLRRDKLTYIRERYQPDCERAWAKAQAEKRTTEEITKERLIMTESDAPRAETETGTADASVKSNSQTARPDGAYSRITRPDGPYSQTARPDGGYSRITRSDGGYDRMSESEASAEATEEKVKAAYFVKDNFNTAWIRVTGRIEELQRDGKVFINWDNLSTEEFEKRARESLRASFPSEVAAKIALKLPRKSGRGGKRGSRGGGNDALDSYGRQQDFALSQELLQRIHDDIRVLSRRVNDALSGAGAAFVSRRMDGDRTPEILFRISDQVDTLLTDVTQRLGERGYLGQALGDIREEFTSVRAELRAAKEDTETLRGMLVNVEKNLTARGVTISSEPIPQSVDEKLILNANRLARDLVEQLSMAAVLYVRNREALENAEAMEQARREEADQRVQDAHERGKRAMLLEILSQFTDLDELMNDNSERDAILRAILKNYGLEHDGKLRKGERVSISEKELPSYQGTVEGLDGPGTYHVTRSLFWFDGKPVEPGAKLEKENKPAVGKQAG